MIKHPQKIACYLEHHHLHHPLHHLPDLTQVIFYCSHSHHHPLPPSNVGINLGFWGNCPPTPPSPKLTLTLTSHLRQNDILGEG